MQTILSLGNALNHGTARGEIIFSLANSITIFLISSMDSGELIFFFALTPEVNLLIINASFPK